MHKQSKVPRPPMVSPSTLLLAGVAIAFGVAGAVDIQIVIMVVLAVIVFGQRRPE